MHMVRNNSQAADTTSVIRKNTVYQQCHVCCWPYSHQQSTLTNTNYQFLIQILLVPVPLKKAPYGAKNFAKIEKQIGELSVVQAKKISKVNKPASHRH